MSATKTLLLSWVLLFSHTLAAQRFSVVITEIMADPSPVVGLPNAEYIELKNRSNAPVDLTGWRLQTSGSTSGPFPAYVLQPDSFVVLTSRTNAPLFGSNTIGIASFPALVNDGTTLTLLSPSNEAVHTVAYTNEWYRNVVKKEGGWSLEMMDTDNPCAGNNNWAASTDASGGTPGRRNSIAGTNKDEAPPQLLRAYTIDSSTLVLVFDEPLDSTRAADVRNYTLNPHLPITAASLAMPGGMHVQLHVQHALSPSTMYTLSVAAVSDCAGNALASKQVLIGLPQPAAASDVVVNEILFNPGPNAHDYIELYNRSNKIIDVQHLFLAQRAENRSLASALQVSNEPLYLFPDGYFVLTENKESLERTYHVKQPHAVGVLPNLPSLPDDEGSVMLLNRQGVVVDELTYSKDWHFALISNAEGVALERIDPNGASQDRNNWTSAAATAGYGTPTYKNSQYGNLENSTATIAVTPKIFSPDNDGYDDRAVISYQLAERGFVANVYIFDAQGRLVRHLVKNETLGDKGSWAWDGLNEQKQPLPVGAYVVYAELFNLNGKKERLKQTVVLARRMN